MINEDEFIDRAIEYANDKIPRELIKDCAIKRSNLELIMEGNEKFINEYADAILKQSAEFYEKAMHYLVVVTGI